MIAKRVDTEGNKVKCFFANDTKKIRRWASDCFFSSKVWSVHKGNHKSCGQAVLQIGNRIIVGGGIGRVDFSKPRVLKTAEVTIQGIIGAMQATLWALDLETGETVWETKLGESLFP